VRGALVMALAVAALGCRSSAAEGSVKEPSAPGGRAPARTIVVTSPAFEAGAEIPTEHTCEGKDVSPPLAIAGVPAGARSLVLVVDDPDAPDPRAPKRTWVHWVVAGLPATTTALPAGASHHLPGGASHGKNDWGKAAWGGPCPPIGRHRYVFKVYALDEAMAATGKDKAALLKAMDGHVLARGELIGTYQKKK
jgi:Raf kinase inhibitor-like YbhB/YbcL family protein